MSCYIYIFKTCLSTCNYETIKYDLFLYIYDNAKMITLNFQCPLQMSSNKEDHGKRNE